MSCESAETLQRLAVIEPQALESPDWRRHLDGCGECSKLLYSLGRSLAVFQHLENESRADCPLSLTWDLLQGKLRQQGRRNRALRRILPAVAAASLLAVLAGGVASLTWHRGAAPRIASRQQTLETKPVAAPLPLRSVRVAMSGDKETMSHRIARAPLTPVTNPLFFPATRQQRTVPAARAPVALFHSLQQMRSLKQGGFSQGSRNRPRSTIDTQSVSFGRTPAYPSALLER